MAQIIGAPLPTTPQKWALFDLDDTLITPTRGRLSTGVDDWIVLPGRVERLRDFIREGFRLGIVTNQKYRGVQLQNTLQRVSKVHALLSSTLPYAELSMMVSTDESDYRKPGTGWARHLGFLPGSLYVGDAVQDPNRPHCPWGHADSDRQFANNIGILFYCVEEVFPQLPLPEGLLQVPKLVLILVGPPGSGKSEFSRRTGFIHIESDAYKSNFDRLKKAYREALSRGEQIVVDATNPSRERRMELIAIAREWGAPVGIVHFLNSGKWNQSRGRKPVPQVAYGVYWKNYRPPDPEIEGVPVYYQT